MPKSPPSSKKPFEDCVTEIVDRLSQRDDVDWSVLYEISHSPSYEAEEPYVIGSEPSRLLTLNDRTRVFREEGLITREFLRNRSWPPEHRYSVTPLGVAVVQQIESVKRNLAECFTPSESKASIVTTTEIFSSTMREFMHSLGRTAWANPWLSKLCDTPCSERQPYGVRTPSGSSWSSLSRGSDTPSPVPPRTRASYQRRGK